MKAGKAGYIGASSMHAWQFPRALGIAEKNGWTRFVSTRLFAETQEADKKVVDRVAEVANARGISRAQVALAWLLAKPVITAPIVGATKLHTSMTRLHRVP
jgi:aryl-alcohol dehydrogenase-like predicted oxidoreductase